MNIEEYKNQIIELVKKSFQSLENVENLNYTEGVDNITNTEQPVTRSIVGEHPKENLTSLFESGQNGLKKIKKNETDLTHRELIGLEAIIVLQHRPAIIIASNEFLPPPPEWKILEKNRNNIQATFPSIGRINVKGHPSHDWLGTGFMVGDDVIMTNEHVAIEFSRPGNNGQWTFRQGYSTSVDYDQDIAGNHNEFKIKEIIGLHDNLDIALLRISTDPTEDSKQLPKPLKIATDVDENKIKDSNVYVVGFPARDPLRNDPVEMDRIFAGVYGVKRLQPGNIMNIDDSTPIMTHDCSTLGGNSGSCVIDLETNNIIGLHFSGRYLQANKAISLWKLKNDPLLNKAGVNFA